MRKKIQKKKTFELRFNMIFYIINIIHIFFLVFIYEKNEQIII
jgi:hypothetical protein